jgi:hypothetical protein
MKGIHDSFYESEPAVLFFKKFCWHAPFGYLCFLFSNEPELGTEIDPSMVMTPFLSSILGRDSNHNLMIVSRIC